MINDTLKQAKEALQKAIDQKKLNQEFMNSLGPAVVELLKPTLEEMVANSKLSKEELLNAIAGIRIDIPQTNIPEANVKVEIPEIRVPQPIVNVTVPEIKIPEPKEIKLPVIKVPKPEVTVNFDASRIKIPDIKMPEEMEVRGWINLMGFDKGLLRNPLPVQIRDAEGNPVSFGGGSSVISGGGGKTDFFTIKDIRASSISVIDQDVGALRVVGNLTASLSSSTLVTLINNDGLAYNSDNPLPITGNISTSPAPQVSGYADSVNVMQYGGVATPTGLNETTGGVFRTVQMTDSISSVYVTGVATSVYAEIMNPDGRVKVELPTGSSGLTDTELRATAVPISQVSGANWSVNVVSSLGLTDTELRASHIDTQQLSGAIDSVYVTGIANSSFTELQNGDGRLRVSVETGGSGLTDAELRASSVPVAQASGALWSVFATGAGASFFAEISNPDGRVKVELPTGSSGLTDTELRASSVPIAQVSGAVFSTSVVTVSDIFSTTVASTVVNPDNRLRVELPAGASGLTDAELRASAVSVHQASGSNWSVSVTNSDLDIRDLNVTQDEILTHQVSGSIWSTNVTNTVTITGSLTSTVVVGSTVADAVDDGSAPLQMGGIARTANPTAVAGNDVVKATFDNLGRQVIRNVQVRGLISTAYVSVANGTETTLLSAGGAGVFLDLIFIQFSNNSTSAVGVDLRSVTGGNIEQHYEIPANGVVGGALPVPWPQSSANNNWTVDLPDVTGTTVTASALFSNEV